MNTATIPRPQPSPLDRIFRLHNPIFRTAPPSCSRCGAPIENLEAWFATECPVDSEIEPR